MRPRIFIRRRDAHQPLDGEAVFLAAALDKGDGFLRRNAGFLFFKSGIHLHVELWGLVLLFDLDGQGGCDLFTVDGFDDIEEGDGIGGLVGLQRADEMQFDAGIIVAQSRPFGLCFLHAVFTEDALACVEDRADFLRIEGFRYGDKRNGTPVALCFLFGIGDRGLDRVQVRYDI